MGISQAMYGEMPMKNGSAIHSNFDGFQVAKMIDAPKAIHVDIVKNDAAPGGVGETGIGSFAPALCNAIFAATGKRIRDLPITPHPAVVGCCNSKSFFTTLVNHIRYKPGA